jgi:hypothetical protein
MQVSDFLNHNVPPATVLYSTFNYPVFAYYTNLRPIVYLVAVPLCMTCSTVYRTTGF